jgi:hypothetical protein
LENDSSIDISNSVYMQLKAMDALTLKKNCDMAKNINSKKRWTNSLKFDFFTDYVEGLACDLFD